MRQSIMPFPTPTCQAPSLASQETFPDQPLHSVREWNPGFLIPQKVQFKELFKVIVLRKLDLYNLELFRTTILEKNIFNMVLSEYWYNNVLSWLPWWLSSEKPPCSAVEAGSVSGLGRVSAQGNGNPLQFSCLGNPTDRGAWWFTVHGVTKEVDMT